MFIDPIERHLTKKLDFLIAKLALVYLSHLDTKNSIMLS
jgi:hypothetical protein